uniref:Uncharacterized protein n=1 Tax=Anopheles atroparvus TaxID=41427 RepID=A0AAG5D1H9_ANOAO
SNLNISYCCCCCCTRTHPQPIAPHHSTLLVLTAPHCFPAVVAPLFPTVEQSGYKTPRETIVFECSRRNERI